MKMIVFLKKIATRLGLRDKQSCAYCGRNQDIVWTIKEEIWERLDKKWHDKSLCLECFAKLLPIGIKLEDFIVFFFPGKKK